jgi:diguanylate cyclase (GGDEF)-like protein
MAFMFSVPIGIFILIDGIHSSRYETWVYLLFINALPVVTERFKRHFNKHKLKDRVIFEEVRGRYEDLAGRDRRQIENNLERERRSNQVLSLYEISKDMSSCLLFEDIFNIFSLALKKSFRFHLSRCVLLRDSKDIESVRQIELGQGIAKVALTDLDRELVAIALETKKIILISPQDDSEFSRRLSVIKGFETLIAIPLFVEEKLAGLLYIENIPRTHFENFVILTAQFAIQFQKVLLYKKVQEMSITDSLTGISTRRYFLERFLEEVRRSMRHKSNLSFLMLDIDHFKEKNDTLGHLVGDVILKEVADILKSDLREIDSIGRYGGEEFAVVLAGIGRDGAFQVAERIRKSVEEAVFRAYDEEVFITLSIGISVFPEDGVDIEALIEIADRALYRAKDTGRNRVAMRD